jgi:hypothetical protein
MATEKYPQRNHNMPMDEGALAAAREKLNPGGGSGPVLPPVSGQGSRREVRPGEWIDDRVNVFGGPASPSEGTPPEPRGMTGKSLPTFETGKVYSVVLGKSCVFAGRTLNPSMKFEMTGDTCLDPNVQPCIVEAEYVGDLIEQQDAAPSGNASKKKA